MMKRALLTLIIAGALAPVGAFAQLPAPRQVRHESTFGYAYKRGSRIPTKIDLGEKSYTRDGKPLRIVRVSSAGTNILSDDRVSSLDGYLHTRTSRAQDAYVYDDAGRMIEKKHSALGVVYRTTFSYDTATRLSNATHYDGGRISGYRLTLYDHADSIVSVCEFDRKHKLLSADSITFDGAHQRIKETHLEFGDGERLISGSTRNYNYDDNGRLSGISDESEGRLNSTHRYTYVGDDPLPASLIDGQREWRYKYNANGELVEETETYSGRTVGYRRFEYDNYSSVIRETSYNAKEQLLDEILTEVEYW